MKNSENIFHQGCAAVNYNIEFFSFVSDKLINEILLYNSVILFCYLKW